MATNWAQGTVFFLLAAQETLLKKSLMPQGAWLTLLEGSAGFPSHTNRGNSSTAARSLLDRNKARRDSYSSSV